MGEVLAFPGTTLPTEPEPVPFEEWRDEQIADFLGHVTDLDHVETAEQMQAVARTLVDQLLGWVGG